MKRAFFLLLAVTVVTALAGCCGHQGHRVTDCIQGSCANVPENCQTCASDCDACGVAACQACGGHGCGLCRRAPFVPGPPTGAITYPYYTNRGPRDFLAVNPPSIGP
ncbi:MAG: hypothetical protein JXB62_01235 [Pirellulales bacterium]|nr:hypothetical protein [Pirellulales bacterium]